MMWLILAPTAMEPLIGRTAELVAIDRALTTLGRARVLELVGEPGMGKTRLLAELSARAAARGLRVLSGSASELARDLPFGVFVDALEEQLPADGLDPELGLVFPALGAPPTLQQERYRAHRAGRVLLEALAPLVLVLDDLHWADAG